jgi:inner membrane protein
VDPLTHALVGAAAARVAVGRPLGRAAWLPGAVGALLPDADALVRSSADPLLYAEFHRHFTHSLAFIPIGGAIAALPWLLQARHRRRAAPYLGAATIGYVTHGLLDAATTWGTRLYWPFSDERVAWNVISIVDPIFTLILAAGVAVALWRRSARPAALALLVCLAYLAAGAVQQARARDAQAQIAAARGHVVQRAATFPGFATNILWRSLYQADGMLHADRLRVPWWGAPTWSAGYSMPLLRESDLDPGVQSNPRSRRDFGRFATFANGWLARAPADPELLGDARYSLSPDRFEPVWGIRFASDKSQAPVAWVDRSRSRRVDPAALWREVIGHQYSSSLPP